MASSATVLLCCGLSRSYDDSSDGQSIPFTLFSTDLTLQVRTIAKATVSIPFWSGCDLT